MPPQPSFFIARPGSVARGDSSGEVTSQPILVPLIPADLLPDYVELEGVSRYLTLAEIRGMTSVGAMGLAGDKYHVKLNLSGDTVLNDSWSSVNNRKAVDETGAPSDPKSTFGDVRQNSTQGVEQFQPIRKEMRDNRGLLDSSLSPIASSSEGPLSSCHNVATEPRITEHAPSFQTDKIRNPIRSGLAAKASRRTIQYCSYWCHYPWSCKYGKHCKKKHQMPSSPKTLQALGLEGFPRWWVDYMHTERLPERPSQGSILPAKGSFTKADENKSGNEKRKAAHKHLHDRGSSRTRACDESDDIVGSELFTGRLMSGVGHVMSHEAARGLRVDNGAGGEMTREGSVITQKERGNLIDFLEDDGIVQTNSKPPPGY